MFLKPRHCLSLPTPAFLSLSLSMFLLCSCLVFASAGFSLAAADLTLYCFDTFLHYLRFSNLCASSPPKPPPNDLICPTFFSLQPPFTFAHFSIISCYFISALMASENSQNSFPHKSIFTFSHHFFTSRCQAGFLVLSVFLLLLHVSYLLLLHFFIFYCLTSFSPQKP